MISDHTSMINYKLDEIINDVPIIGPQFILTNNDNKWFISYGTQGSHYGGEFKKQFIFKSFILSNKKTVIYVNENQDIHDAIKFFLN